MIEVSCGVERTASVKSVSALAANLIIIDQSKWTETLSLAIRVEERRISVDASIVGSSSRYARAQTPWRRSAMLRHRPSPTVRRAAQGEA
jgi:hypothetical protein